MPASEEPPAQVREDIVRFDADEHPEQDVAVDLVVREKAEVPEGRAEQGEAEACQCDTLHEALGAISDQRDYGDQRRDERRQRDEEPVPVVECCEPEAQDAQRDGGDQDEFAEQPRGARVLAEAGDAQHREQHDDRRAAEQDRTDEHGDQNPPRADACEQFTERGVAQLALAMQHPHQHRGDRQRTDEDPEGPTHHRDVEGGARFEEAFGPVHTSLAPSLACSARSACAPRRSRPIAVTRPPNVITINMARASPKSQAQVLGRTAM